MPQSKKKKRSVRVIRETHRHGTEKQGHGWAANQASRRLDHHGNKSVAPTGALAIGSRNKTFQGVRMSPLTF